MMQIQKCGPSNNRQSSDVTSRKSALVASYSHHKRTSDTALMRLKHSCSLTNSESSSISSNQSPKVIKNRKNQLERQCKIENQPSFKDCVLRSIKYERHLKGQDENQQKSSKAIKHRLGKIGKQFKIDSSEEQGDVSGRNISISSRTSNAPKSALNAKSILDDVREGKIESPRNIDF